MKMIKNEFSKLSTDDYVSKETYIDYLVQFYSTSDDADSIMKSLQVLGDPNNVKEAMLKQPPLDDDDIKYLMSKCDDGNSLSDFIQAAFDSE